MPTAWGRFEGFIGSARELTAEQLQAHPRTAELPGAAAILAGDTEEALDRDAEAFEAWCASRGVEVVRVLGISDFRAA